MIVASKREKLGYYLFLAPAFLVFLVFIFIPMIASFVLSFFSYSMTTIKEPEFVGLKNFITLFQTPVFRTAMKNTVVYTAFTVPTTMACGLCIALLINSRLVRRKNFYKVCYYIPYVSSMVAVAIVFSLVFNSSPNGIMNQILGKLGIAPVGWLSNDKWAMFVVVLLSVWKELGYVMVIYTGGLLSISQDIYEAVSLDPISSWKKLIYITLPMLRPTTLFLLVVETIGSFQVFTPVQIMTNGGPGYSTTTIVTYLYQKGFQEYKMGMASAIAVIMFVILLFLSILQNKATSQR
ncbi:carbohydrate ABC transporter permease [Phascolarctobacterium sp.]|uniref:carbohydrate ABC transporter permease n=1 Tax=Phascolarctobacterium sp. TaxID=2049039 RepID=UPI003AB6B48C